MLERLSQIVRAERGALVAVARAEGLPSEDAVECVQDALCTFLTREQRGEGIPEEHAVASLVVMVRNAARNARRRHRRAMPHAPIEADAEPPAETTDADVLLANAEDVVRLRACVAELCSVQRAVVMLRLLEERSGEDVAEVLGITRGHVDVLVHRAKGSLRVCMRHAASGDAGVSR
ncbi:MAG: sigma-70 family RNA polymerase sigma factor [Deltaproteobacteria bacterium]|nr:sigma-70 family RNA polymerase sigma factor [Deltaproteobacteria bacterium]